MKTKIEIRQALKPRVFNVTTARITKTAKSLDLGDRNSYEDWEADLIIDAIAGQKQAEPKPQTDHTALAQRQEKNEGAIANVVQARIDQINSGAIALAQKLDRYEVGVADAIAQRLNESEARIYAHLDSKLQDRQSGDFSLDVMVEEIAVAPDLGGSDFFALPANIEPPQLTGSFSSDY